MMCSAAFLERERLRRTLRPSRYHWIWKTSFRRSTVFLIILSLLFVCFLNGRYSKSSSPCTEELEEEESNRELSFENGQQMTAIRENEEKEDKNTFVSTVLEQQSSFSDSLVEERQPTVLLDWKKKESVDEGIIVTHGQDLLEQEFHSGMEKKNEDDSRDNLNQLNENWWQNIVETISEAAAEETANGTVENGSPSVKDESTENYKDGYTSEGELRDVTLIGILPQTSLQSLPAAHENDTTYTDLLNKEEPQVDGFEENIEALVNRTNNEYLSTSFGNTSQIESNSLTVVSTDTAEDDSAISSHIPSQQDAEQREGLNCSTMGNVIMERLADVDVVSTLPNSTQEVVHLLLVFHGCQHQASDWFSLPEEKLVVCKALERNFSVLALSSLNRFTGCWDLSYPAKSNADFLRVVTALQEWSQKYLGFDITENESVTKKDVNIYALGASSGGNFVSILSTKLPVTAQAIYISPGSFHVFRENDWLSYPPTTFLYMPKDTIFASHERVSRSCELLKQSNISCRMQPLATQPITPGWFHEKIPNISYYTSVKMFELLNQSHVLDSNGNLLRDPREMDYQRLFNTDQTLKMYLEPFRNELVEILNRAYGVHEMASDYIEDVLDWFISVA